MDTRYEALSAETVLKLAEIFDISVRFVPSLLCELGADGAPLPHNGPASLPPTEN